MSFPGNQVWGLAFLAIAAGAMLLMFKAWGYPYDKETHRSSAPRWMTRSHRVLGILFVVIYLYLMWQMVPRLWTYQIELPARTVAHLVLGMAIGGLLLVKIVIIRFFKHLEARLVPLLGVALFLSTLVLVFLALPLTLRESFLRDVATQGDAFSEDRIERVRLQLPRAGLDDDKLLAELTTTDGLLIGRQVLTDKCVQCHDLRTVLVRPRTPDGWRQTVRRMANRSTILAPISDREQWYVTAYLVAISPTLQKSLMQKRDLDMETVNTQQAIVDMAKSPMMPDPDFDLAAAETVFQARCSQCHAYQLVDAKPPGSADDVQALVSRMVRNGLVASDEDLSTVVRYLNANYVKAGATPPAPAAQPSPDASNAQFDREIILRPAGTDLMFEMPELTAKAGQRVRLVLENSGSGGNTHNFVLVEDASQIDDVIDASFAAAATGFAPEHPAVLATIAAVADGSRGEVVFEVPPPGEYVYICMMPGHSSTMRGVLRSLP